MRPFCKRREGLLHIASIRIPVKIGLGDRKSVPIATFAALIFRGVLIR
tara:strand:+ start:1734 stop:1877 length:144 start_codon:yes stop_codon:yes gene_type:complete